MKTFTLKVSDLKKCPAVILLPTHYREDGSCRCNEVICEYEGCSEAKYQSQDGLEIYCKKHFSAINLDSESWTLSIDNELS